MILPDAGDGQVYSVILRNAQIAMANIVISFSYIQVLLFFISVSVFVQ